MITASTSTANTTKQTHKTLRLNKVGDYLNCYCLTDLEIVCVTNIQNRYDNNINKCGLDKF